MLPGRQRAKKPMLPPPTSKYIVQRKAEVRMQCNSRALVRAKLLQILDRPRVPPDPIQYPPLQADGLDLSGLSVEHVATAVEMGERCPLLLVRLLRLEGKSLYPVFVLHGTNDSKFTMLQKGFLQRYARLGFVAIGVDSRHMGERAPADKRSGNAAYWEACISAWRVPDGDKQNYPFIWDTVWDMMRLLDWFESDRADVDTSHVGAIGISLGGMQVWFWAALDVRVTAPAPAIGVQSFGYALQNDCWLGRVKSLQPLFDAVTQDLHRPTDAASVHAVWAKLLPGLLEYFDAQYTLSCIAPRPLLIANNAADPRTPRAGVEEAVAIVRPLWGVESRLQLLMDESVAPTPLPAEDWARGHVVTSAMWHEIDKFIEQHLQ
mmetsp:Transcript_64869/g.107844  ORF Transcript_64869/g.107844 Transcript_64869/m.107844 type:complete len:377 (+) Transcript_64869:302-1432(+)